MANVLVEESSLQAIANAIRNKTGGNDTYKPREMAPAIRNLPGTGVLQNLSVTENGNYAPAAGVDGFGLVSVAVPNSALTSTDEGKVVVSGALMPQTSLNVSANGTYDTTTKNSVIVNVSGSGGGGATILSGTSEPTAAQGSDGNIYLREVTVTAIESIRSNGNQWIQTGYAPQADNVIFELDVTIDSVNSGNSGLICRASPRCWIITHIGSTPNLTAAWGGTDNRSDQYNITGRRVRIHFEKGRIIVKETDNTVVCDWSFSAGSSYSNTEMTLFGYAPNDSLIKATLYDLKIYEGQTLVRHYIPVLDSSNEPCLYETKTGAFFYNAGSGSFEAGAASGGVISTVIAAAYLKVNGAWQDLIGSDIDDVGGVS